MITVVIPCYKVKNQILQVLSEIPEIVGRIIAVDDACPEHSGKYILENCTDPRVEVLFHEKNLGVGGAVKTAYRRALEEGASIVVKLDGDGQMNPALISRFIDPVLKKTADYVKGNRFYDFSYLKGMPWIRKLGNSLLSFVSKMVSGYWNIMDPSNGYTAISAEVLKHLPLEKIDNRYFFESDMLFRLYTIRAVVRDIPMKAVYGTEQSSLKIHQVFCKFPPKYLTRLFKRIFYNYFLRDFNIGSVELVISFILMTFGIIFGIIKWTVSIETARPATAGTVLLAGLPIILGFQSLINFIHFDVGNVPEKPITQIIGEE
ncbi:MAG: glycosyltransferase family 2 protein [Bacteroidota bacterium]|nr:glycosyltransferase family 2 protein [Bacteroidota bacterium]